MRNGCHTVDDHCRQIEEIAGYLAWVFLGRTVAGQ
jgi:hypothetical protein